MSGAVRTLRAALMVTLALAAGCGRNASPPAVPSHTGATARAAAEVWLTRSGLLHPVRRGVAGQGARAAMRRLLAGPTGAERAAGVQTAIPRGTRVLALRVTRHSATVNLSERFASNAGDSRGTVLRLAQVVYTLTAVPGIRSVIIQISGRPLTGGHRRADYRGVTGG
jgi:Sporulation and spore germination